MKPTTRNDRVRGPLTVPLRGETVTVRKQPVTTGSVRLHKTVRERMVHIDEPLVDHGVVIDRRPVGRFIDGVVAPRREGDTLVIPVLEEVLVTRLRLVEEVRIRLRRSVRRHRAAVRLRREAVEIERRTRRSAPDDQAIDAQARPRGDARRTPRR